jgi:hypothetical protein
VNNKIESSWGRWRRRGTAGIEEEYIRMKKGEKRGEKRLKYMLFDLLKVSDVNKKKT